MRSETTERNLRYVLTAEMTMILALGAMRLFQVHSSAGKADFDAAKLKAMYKDTYGVAAGRGQPSRVNGVPPAPGRSKHEARSTSGGVPGRAPWRWPSARKTCSRWTCTSSPRTSRSERPSTNSSS